MKSKLPILALMLLALLVLPPSTPALAAVKVGSTCQTINQTRVVSGIKLVCKLVKKKRIWQKAPITVSAPSGLKIKLFLSPVALGDPGMLNDPEPEVLQDGGKNSSFVIQVSKGGKPYRGAQISYSLSDPTANLQLFSKTTDIDGKTRGWLINGAAPELRIRFTAVGAIEAAEIVLTRGATIKPTSGRPVIATFEPSQGRKYDQVEVEATPNSAPVGTYYAFANFSNFYTGIQSVLCNGWDKYAKVCDSQRGQYQGREGHFSVWNGVDAQGVVRAPIVVSKSEQTICSPFDHEGNGQMCFVAFDWLVGHKIRISMRHISGAGDGYFRLEVKAHNVTQNRTQEFAVIDVPVKLNLSEQFATFNEHYLVASAKSCLDIEERSITVNSVKFMTGPTVEAPARLSFYGNLVAPEASLCQNYGYESTPKGLELFSGGTGRFVSIAPALPKGYFVDTHQSKLMLRYLDLGSLSKY